MYTYFLKSLDTPPHSCVKDTFKQYIKIERYPDNVHKLRSNLM